MDFTLTDEQEMLEQSVAGWAAGVRASGAHREVVNGKLRAIENLWSDPVRNGWLGIISPTEHGGSGGTLIDACLVLFPMYRELVPLPFATNAVLVPAAVQLLGGPPELLAELAAGRRRVALGVSADLAGPGTERAWEWTDDAEVAACTSDGVVVTAGGVEGATGTDLLWPLGMLRRGGVAPAPAGSWGSFTPVLDVVCSAVMVGLMDGAARMAVEYAKDRQQFGQPIGAFQAVQHLCAEMHVDVEASRAACLGAASAVHADMPDARRAAAVAKAWCAEASTRVVETAIQVLGGIGNTWESDAHLYLRSCHQWRSLGGGAAAALDAVANDLFTDGVQG